jgi:hypothetical protein
VLDVSCRSVQLHTLHRLRRRRRHVPMVYMGLRVCYCEHASVAILMGAIQLITCRSLWLRYVLRQPALPYLVPPWVHMKTVPKPVCSTLETFSIHLGHTLSSLLAHDKQKTCLQGICKQTRHVLSCTLIRNHFSTLVHKLRNKTRSCYSRY